MSGDSPPLNDSLTSAETVTNNDTVIPKEPASASAQPSPSLTNDPTSFLKSISDQAKVADVDPTMLMFAQLITQNRQITPPIQVQTPNLVDTKSLSSAIGKMVEGEDIFVFLHRFEFELTTRAIAPHRWLTCLPSVLIGQFKEAYYNNASVCTSYEDMKIVLLNVGGYSISECLNSFPLKFRMSGNRSLLQWYNGWKYKFQVILDSLPFLVNCSDKLIDEMSSVFATIGVLAGFTSDQRNSILSKQCETNQSFIQECNTWYTTVSSSIPKSHSGPHSHSNSHFDHNFRPHRNSFHSKPQSHSSPSSNYRPSHFHSDQSVNSSNPPQSPRRDLQSVTCYKCGNLGLYANCCPTRRHHSGNHSHPPPTNPPTQSIPSNQVTPPPQPVAQAPPIPPPRTRPEPVPRNSRPIRMVDFDNSSDVLSQSLVNDFTSNPINSFDEEDLVTYGCINGIETPIDIDSGARISLISDDFIDIDYEPVKFVNITGISQVPKSVPVFEIPVELPTLTGVCLLAVDSRLPPRTALFGTDFGKSNLLDLIAHVRSDPVPVLTVTRAMQAENELAEQIAGALHASDPFTD